MSGELKQFLYQFKPSRSELLTDPESWTEEELKIGEAHFAHLQKATKEGIVILAGRSLDGKGPAVVIFEAASDEEGRYFMESDPFVSSGLMMASLHPFRAALVREP